MARATGFGPFLPGLVAVLITIAYFVVIDGWNRLATPVPGLVAIGAGLVGFGLGELVRGAARHGDPDTGA